MRSDRTCRTTASGLAVLIAAAFSARGAASAATGDVVVEWNEIAMAATATAGQGPVPQTRTAAIVQVSVHDAVNAITGTYEPYAADLPSPAGASGEAAAIAAAHYSLTHLFPPQATALDSQYAASLLAHGLSVTDPGIALGETVAAEILALRASDHASEAQFPYTAPGAGNVGVWVPTPPAFAPALVPGWGKVSPWVIRSGSQFRPDEGPPSLTSRRYAADYNEVKDLGSVNSLIRTPEQTEIAKFWVASAAVIWNAVLRQVAPARGLSLSESAHAFALMNLASADAAIACWDTKYTFNSWRPVTAIQRGDEDGNPRTAGDPAWLPLIVTPPFPEFTSGHATISSAMASVLEATLGNDPGVPIRATSPTNPAFVRDWRAFSEGVAEVIDARVFSGIHFRNSDELGARIGQKVARFVTGHALRGNCRDHE